MRIEFESCSQNEAFARTVVAAYITRLNPTLEELSDVKTSGPRMMEWVILIADMTGKEICRI